MAATATPPQRSRTVPPAAPPKAAGLRRSNSAPLFSYAVISVVALVLRLRVAMAALPYVNHPDEPQNIRTGVAMAVNGTVDPHWYNYPSMLFDAIDAVSKTWMFFGSDVTSSTVVTSQMMGVSRTDYSGLVLSLRLVTVVLSIGCCLVVAETVRRLSGNLLPAIVAGLALAITPLMVMHGGLVTPDTYSAFFTAVALALSLRLLRRGGAFDYLLAGAAVGLSAGAKYNAALVGVAVVAAHMSRARHPSRWRAAPLALVGAAGAFCLVMPGVLIDPRNVWRGIQFEMRHYQTGHPGAQGNSFDFYTSLLLRHQTLLLVIAIIGIVAIARRRAEIVVITSFAVSYLTLLSSQFVHFDRNLLPLLPALALLGGLGVDEILRWQKSRRSVPPFKLIRHVALPATLVVLVIPTIWESVDAATVIEQPNREAARDWIANNVPPGSPIVIDAYSPYLRKSNYRVITLTPLVAPSSSTSTLVMTEIGMGRFAGQAVHYPGQVASYQRLRSEWCSAARFTNGPWIEILRRCSRAPSKTRD